MKQLRQKLHDEQCSCVVRNGSDVRVFRQRGVADLLYLYDNDRAFLAGAEIADKVVGKAAAALMVLGGVRHLYAATISTPALQLLASHGVQTEYGHETEHIINRAGTDWCPLEKLSRDEAAPAVILQKIRTFLLKQNS
jgi:iron complex outermembrane receptor protein